MDRTSFGLDSALLLMPAIGGVVAAAQAGPSGNGAGTEFLTVQGRAASATGSLDQALRLKRDSANLIEVQPQSEIRKLPDVDVAEALQRVSGISLETDTGEGHFVNIRGLDADLNGVSFDGVRLMPSDIGSPFGGGRAIALDAIPAGFVGGLEVVKTQRPDQDAEALGGSINVIPREPKPDGPPSLDVNAGGGCEPLRRTPVVQGGVTFSGSFGRGANGSPTANSDASPRGGFFSNDKPFGIVDTATVYNDQRGVDDVEESYSDNQGGGTPDKVLSQLNPRYQHYWRRRYSEGGSFQYDPNRDNQFYFRLAESGYSEHVKRHGLVLDSLDSGSGLGGTDSATRTRPASSPTRRRRTRPCATRPRPSRTTSSSKAAATASPTASRSIVAAAGRRAATTSRTTTTPPSPTREPPRSPTIMSTTRSTLAYAPSTAPTSPTPPTTP